jgi:GTPase-associated protein 1
MDAMHTTHTFRALQHLFSSVERGYSPHQGRGFQTVAVAKELVGTEDLQALERASFYALGHDRRANGSLPVKETFFQLPSGRFAIGRTVDWGMDSLGREGNYLAHHLVVSREDLLAAGATPFPILDAAPLAERSLDLSPRELPPMMLELPPGSPEPGAAGGVDPDCLAALAVAVLEGGEKTTLLIGDEQRSRALLRALGPAMATEERLKLTFSSHFHESDHLRPLFAVASVASLAEAPSGESYQAFELDTGSYPRSSPATAHAAWLAECIRARRWDEIRSVNELLDRLRAEAHVRAAELGALPGEAVAALWEKVKDTLVPVLLQDPEVTTEILARMPAPRPLADALLKAASPTDLCGPEAEAERAGARLTAFRAAASPRAWRSWVKRWRKDPIVDRFTRNPRPWWRRILRIKR